MFRFLGGELEPEIRAYIGEQRKIEGSKVHRWFAELDQKLADPLNIDWSAVEKGAEAE